MNFLNRLRGTKRPEDADGAPKDSFVDSCFDFIFREVPENRNWEEIIDLSEIFSKEMKDAFSGNTESCYRAIPLLNAQLQKYPDYDLLYCWLGFCKKALYGPNEARRTYLEGIEKSRSRAVICGRLGMLAFEEYDLPDAVKWWIRSCAIQVTGEKYVDGFSFLNLATIAKYLGLKKCYSKLWHRSLAIKDQAFTGSGEQQRALMAQQQRSEPIIEAIEKFCKNYRLT
jgi:hypothetical protein